LQYYRILFVKYTYLLEEVAAFAPGIDATRGNTLLEIGTPDIRISRLSEV